MNLLWTRGLVVALALGGCVTVAPTTSSRTVGFVDLSSTERTSGPVFAAPPTSPEQPPGALPVPPRCAACVQRPATRNPEPAPPPKPCAIGTLLDPAPPVSLVCAPNVVLTPTPDHSVLPVPPVEPPTATPTAKPSEATNFYQVDIRKGSVTLTTDSVWLLALVIAATLTAMLFLLFSVGRAADELVTGSGAGPSKSKEGTVYVRWMHWQTAARRLAIVVGAVLLTILFAMLVSTHGPGSDARDAVAGYRELRVAIDDLALRVAALPRGSGVVVDGVGSPNYPAIAVFLFAGICVMAIATVALALWRDRRPRGPEGPATAPSPPSRPGPGDDAARTKDDAVLLGEGDPAVAARTDTMARPTRNDRLGTTLRAQIAAVQDRVDVLLVELEVGDDAKRELALAALRIALDAFGRSMDAEHGAVWSPFQGAASTPEVSDASNTGKTEVGDTSREKPVPLPTSSHTFDRSIKQWWQALERFDGALRAWRPQASPDRLVLLEDAYRALRRLEYMTRRAPPS